MDGWMDGACTGYFFHWILCSPVTTSPYPKGSKNGVHPTGWLQNGKMVMVG